ncbi:MAG: hypothetical protein ACK5KT_04100 [Dysgonomonas sp.]
MLSKGIRKYVSNPVVGLSPFILFIILRVLDIAPEFALIAGLVLALIGETTLRTYYKSRGFSVSFYISGISLLITLLIWVVTKGNTNVNEPFTYIVLSEILVICLLMILRASKTYVASTFFRQKNLFQKALMNEYFDSITLIQYILTLHIFGILLYRQFTIDREYIQILDVVIFAILPAFIILSIGVYQFLKIGKLASKLKKEEWLPIVTEKGEVTGKIAKSISLNMKNKFLHPIVRVALISNSKVYLQKRPLNDILNPDKLDYPFEKYMLFNHEINLAARNSIKKMVGEDLSDVSVKFLLKYIFENDNTRRLIFLFVANLDDEDKIKREGKMNGKFWTVKQLEEGFSDEIFSECFELEFEYLKNMVLIQSDVFAN